MVLLLSIVIRRNQVKGGVGWWRILDRKSGSNVAVWMQRVLLLRRVPSTLLAWR